MNPLYQQMNKQATPNIIEQFRKFQQSFKGDPQQQVQQLLNSGKVTQEQYNRAVQTANTLMQMFK